MDVEIMTYVDRLPNPTLRYIHEVLEDNLRKKKVAYADNYNARLIAGPKDIEEIKCFQAALLIIESVAVGVIELELQGLPFGPYESGVAEEHRQKGGRHV